MTASDGYIKIFRSIDKYGKDPVRLKAWLYLIIDAKWNGTEVGKVTTTWTKLATRWELFTKTNRGEVPNINQAKRLVGEMVKDGRVEVCKQVVSKVSAKCKQEVSLLLINYANLQGKDGDGVSNVSASCKQVVSNDKNELVPEPASKSLRIKNKELRIRKENIRKDNTEPHTLEKPESKDMVRRVTDYMWNKYEERYGVRPGSKVGTAACVRLRPLVTEWGEEVSKKAWDAWLDITDKIPLECNHSPLTFSSDFWFDQCRVKATKKPSKTRFSSEGRGEKLG